MSRTLSKKTKTNSKKKYTPAVETYDVIVPVDFTIRITVSSNYPNRRSRVQTKAKEEAQRLLGKELSLQENLSFGRAHSRKVNKED